MPIVTDTNELFENVLFANDLNLVTILLALILILIIQSSNHYTHAEQPSCCGMCKVLASLDNYLSYKSYVHWKKELWAH